MNPWSARRKTFIFFLTIFIAGVLIGLPAYFLLTGSADCSNRFQDGDETGVDCGGSCQLLCVPEVLPLISRGDIRLLKIATSTYEAVILIENPNVNGSVSRAGYAISIYSGASNNPVRVFERETFIPRNSSFAIFEGPFSLEETSSLRAVFEWAPNLVWEKDTDPTPFLTAESINIVLTDASLPRLEARLVNHSQRDERNIEAVALLSDASGNIVAAGKTFVEELSAGESAPIVFSWPQAFGVEPVSVKILPRVLPDRSFLR